MALSPDLIELLREFGAAEVRYLLIGGQALGFHGAPRFTKVTDFWIPIDPDNLHRVTAALQKFGAPEATVRALSELKGLDVAWMGNPPVRFDFMAQVPGGDFEAAWSRRVTSQWEGAPVQVISADDLIQLKRASGRPQDLLDADMLAARKNALKP